MSNGPTRLNETMKLDDAVLAATTPEPTQFELDCRTVWVDVDATLAIYHGWKGIYDIGPPIGGAVRFMSNLRRLGKKLNFRIGLYTVRTTVPYPGREAILRDHPEIGTEAEMAKKLANIVEGWAFANGIEFDTIWTGQGKPLGLGYVDDRGIHCSPQADGPNAYEMALWMVEMAARPQPTFRVRLDVKGEITKG